MDQQAIEFELKTLFAASGSQAAGDMNVQTFYNALEEYLTYIGASLKAASQYNPAINEVYGVTMPFGTSYRLVLRTDLYAHCLNFEVEKSGQVVTLTTQYQAICSVTGMGRDDLGNKTKINCANMTPLQALKAGMDAIINDSTNPGRGFFTGLNERLGLGPVGPSIY